MLEVEAVPQSCIPQVQIGLLIVFMRVAWLSIAGKQLYIHKTFLDTL
jgi:hypothetical protein